MNIDLKEDIKPLSNLRSDPAALLKQVQENHRPLVITDRGKPAAILVDVEYFQKENEKMALMEAILDGEKDIQEGHMKALNQLNKELKSWLKI